MREIAQLLIAFAIPIRVSIGLLYQRYPRRQATAIARLLLRLEREGR